MTPTTSTVRIPIKDRPLKPKPEPEPRIQILKDQSVGAIADHILQGKAKKIIVMTGAGISTAAGIKDFRSPGTGLYDDLEKYNLPFPEAVFDLAFFKESPLPFYQLAKHLYPGQYRPTLTHYLLPLLAKKKLLLRSYTQNIDSLERLAGLDEDLLVEAHGSFATAKCIQCDMVTDSAWVKQHIMASEIPYCNRCSGLVKPSITFFGESLPRRFSTQIEKDFQECDLLIVLGTSLKVEPFNKLIAQVSPKCPRLLINREKAGQELHSGFDFEDKWKYTIQRDALFLGNCDEGVRALADLCGWETELQAMYDEGHAKLNLAEDQEKAGITEKEDPNEDDDADKDDRDFSDDLLVLSASSDSLEDITHQFQRSTLISQPDDSLTEAEHNSKSGPSDSSIKESAGKVSEAMEETSTTTAPLKLTTDGPLTTRQSAHENFNTATTSKQPVQNSEAASVHSVKATETLSSKSTTTIHLSETSEVASTSKDGPALTDGHDSVAVKAEEARDIFPAASTKKPEEGVTAGVVMQLPIVSEATAVPVTEDIEDVLPSLRSTSSSSCGADEPYMLSPMASFQESSSSDSSEMRQTSTSTPPYTPLTTSTDGSDVSRSLYAFVPMMAAFTSTETGVDHEMCVKHTFGGHSSLQDGASGLVQMMRRKRRMESENLASAAAGASTTTSPKREMKSLRGPGTAPPRVTKRRRVD
ncbi:NAD-dependent protein deacetylase sirtuin-2 [Linnemannia schmuckeri]|uniref:NAD-dependent protein deacetylase sirtuin-2 n=1 Tax=Linnemannia schmuckeri TaxID=64567 RepID=A0A9P5RSB6_9FUNG|nr:NAD-dependent protein deacetylase sirtuin-2 [Linnemannia schmuckeri]